MAAESDLGQLALGDHEFIGGVVAVLVALVTFFRWLLGLAALIAYDPEDWKSAVDMLPDWARPLVGLAVAGAAIWARVRSQPGIAPKGDGQ